MDVTRSARTRSERVVPARHLMVAVVAVVAAVHTGRLHAFRVTFLRSTTPAARRLKKAQQRIYRQTTVAPEVAPLAVLAQPLARLLAA